MLLPIVITITTVCKIATIFIFGAVYSRAVCMACMLSAMTVAEFCLTVKGATAFACFRLEFADQLSKSTLSKRSPFSEHECHRAVIPVSQCLELLNTYMCHALFLLVAPMISSVGCPKSVFFSSPCLAALRPRLNSAEVCYVTIMLMW